MITILALQVQWPVTPFRTTCAAHMTTMMMKFVWLRGNAITEIQFNIQTARRLRRVHRENPLLGRLVVLSKCMHASN